MLKKNHNLQALRGIAILSVGIFHFTYQWHSLFFYGEKVDSNIFRIGSLGVNSFFCISGYIVYKSILLTKSAKYFLFKRAKRLVPTLIIVSPFLFCFQKNFSKQIFPKLNITDVLSSIFILNPTFIHYVTNFKIKFISGVMWTLTYELTFYFLLAIVYFKISKKNVFDILFAFTFTVLITNYFYLITSGTLGKIERYDENVRPSLEFTLRQLGLFSLCWFLIGMWFCERETYLPSIKKRLQLCILIIAGTWDAIGGRDIFYNLQLMSFKLLYLVIVLSFMNVISKKGKVLFPKKLQLFLEKVGDVSYEFYLIHEVIGVTILSSISNQFKFNEKTQIFYGIISIVAVVFIIYVFSKIIKNTTDSIINLIMIKN